MVYEDLPTHPNLLGQVEQVAHMGALVTDFTLIKAGALHRANGGYLLLDVRRLLGQPYAWDELKRSLRSQELRVDRLPQGVLFMAAASIEPEPIPLDLKVILLGDRELFLLLSQADPDIAELFRIRADFDDRARRTPETERLYGSLLATIARREGLRPLEAGAAAAVIDHAARLADHAERLTTNVRALTDLIRESDRMATLAAGASIAAEHVGAAIAARRRRVGRIAEEMRAAIVEGMLRIQTDGRAVGEVNGLSVAIIGEDEFGWPTRITAQVRLGRGEVIDIEREVALGGPIHSKGVLILSGFLGGRFGQRKPLALHVSLVFEQSYGGVEGDSASMAELCAVLSAIAGVPLSQSLAITGSVDQLGRSQAVGGVNEKIEGYFDLCAARGLTGEQGVIIPSANVRTLMLRDDVLAAVREGRFRIHGIDSVDDAMQLLGGLPAGAAGADGSFPEGSFPEGSFNWRVRDQLDRLVEISVELGSPRGRRSAGQDESGQDESGQGESGQGESGAVRPPGDGGAQSGRQVQARTPAQVLGNPGERQRGRKDLAGAGRGALDRDRRAQLMLECVQELVHAGLRPGGDVPGPVPVAVGDRQERGHDVRDMDKVAALLAAAVDGDGLPGQELLDEDRHDAALQVPALARPVDVGQPRDPV